MSNPGIGECYGKLAWLVVTGENGREGFRSRWSRGSKMGEQDKGPSQRLVTRHFRDNGYQRLGEFLSTGLWQAALPPGFGAKGTVLPGRRPHGSECRATRVLATINYGILLFTACYLEWCVSPPAVGMSISDAGFETCHCATVRNFSKAVLLCKPHPPRLLVTLPGHSPRTSSIPTYAIGLGHGASTPSCREVINV